MKIKQLFNPKYKNRILNKIRELEIEQSKIKMDLTHSFSNSTEHAKLICNKGDIEKDIKLLKSLL